MKHLYLMRHGETLFNKQGKIQGWCDSPLTNDGIAQAKKAGELLKGIQFDHYYSSTSERCCDTLELVVGKKVYYERLKGLKERNFGSFEGEHEYLNPNVHEGFNYDSLFPNYDGETSAECIQRMVDTVHEIMRQENETVLVVSHAGSCYHFLNYVTDPSPIMQSGGIKNCNILHFTYENDKFEFIEIFRI